MMQTKIYTFIAQTLSYTPLVFSPLQRSTRHSNTRFMSRKAGVVEVSTLQDFITKAGTNLLVADVRNPDAEVEPGDQKSIAVAPLPAEGIRPRAKLLTFDRLTGVMPLPDVDKGTPIITHCGSGGRGQKAKDFLEAAGFTNVVNGGGPKEKELWELFGDK